MAMKRSGGCGVELRQSKAVFAALLKSRHEAGPRRDFTIVTFAPTPAAGVPNSIPHEN